MEYDVEYVDANAPRQIKKSGLSALRWDLDMLSDDEQDTIRYAEDIAEGAEKIMNQMEKGRPVLKSDWNDLQSIIRAFKIVSKNVE
jgi:hypothetical protein